MRVGPFSQKQTIDFIHTHFVPIFLSNEAYKSGKFGADERDLLVKIRRKAKSKGMRAGSVQVYLLSPDGEVVDVLPVAKASQRGELLTFLRKAAEDHKLQAGPRLITTRSNATNPTTTDSQLAVHLAAQYKPRQKIMVEDWILLEPHEWQVFFPPSKGDRNWTIDDRVTRKLLVRLYPYALNWNHDLDQVKIAQLDASVISQTDQETIVGLRGKLEMTHMLQVRTGKQQVNAELTGFAVLRKNKKPELTIITEQARFGNRQFEGLLQTAVTK